MSTPCQLLANRQNALKSTGPKSEAGKSISRRNALKHGLTSRVVDIPDEDPNATTERTDHWQGELNPEGSRVLGYFVAITVRETIKLDRCHAISTARTARLAREAVKMRKEARLRDVEECRRLFDVEPDVAVRRLKTTTEGVDLLIAEWDALRVTLLTDTPHWDNDDGIRFVKLRGTYVDLEHPGPDPTALCSLALAEHREVKARLKANESDLVPWQIKYRSPEDHQHDRDRSAELASKALQARDELLWQIGREVDALRSIKADHARDDQIDLLEVTTRSKFDTSDDGKLLRRYEHEIQRGLFRSMEEIRKQKKMELDLTQVDQQQDITDNPTPDPAHTPAEIARPNEPNLAAQFGPPEGPNPSGHATSADLTGGFPGKKFQKKE